MIILLTPDFPRKKKKIPIARLEIAHKIETLSSSLYPLIYLIFPTNSYYYEQATYFFANQQKNFITASDYFGGGLGKVSSSNLQVDQTILK